MADNNSYDFFQLIRNQKKIEHDFPNVRKQKLGGIINNFWVVNAFYLDTLFTDTSTFLCSYVEQDCCLLYSCLRMDILECIRHAAH